MDLSGVGEWFAKNATELIVGLIVLLVGSLIIWLVARLVAWWTRRVRRENARFYLRAEIEDNLDRLGHLWADINQEPGIVNVPTVPDVRGAVRLLRREAPPECMGTINMA